LEVAGDSDQPTRTAAQSPRRAARRSRQRLPLATVEVVLFEQFDASRVAGAEFGDDRGSVQLIGVAGCRRRFGSHLGERDFGARGALPEEVDDPASQRRAGPGRERGPVPRLVSQVAFVVAQLDIQPVDDVLGDAVSSLDRRIEHGTRREALDGDANEHGMSGHPGRVESLARRDRLGPRVTGRQGEQPTRRASCIVCARSASSSVPSLLPLSRNVRGGDRGSNFDARHRADGVSVRVRSLTRHPVPLS